jgi:ribose transport system ATP-binding protein
MTAEPNPDTPLLEARGIRKSFNGVEVLHGIDFTLRRGQVHGLVGQNGAGKSTLMKILSGVYQRDGGETLIDGMPVQYDSPLGAREHGIAMVFQEFSLVSTMTVAQNVLLTREPTGRAGLIDEHAARVRTMAAIEPLGVAIDPDAQIGDLPIGQRQLVEVAKAISQQARILILDEPTASLPAGEIATLFEAIRRLTATGIGIVYISHHLQELLAICDHVTVLRDGAVTRSAPSASMSVAEVIRAMLGQSLERELDWKPREHDPGVAPLLRVDRLRTMRVHDISFEVHAGEIVGIAGLLGSGRTEVLRALFGLDRADGGTIELASRPVRFGSPRDALAAGVALVPEDRRRAGLVPDHAVRTNILMAAWSRISRAGLVRERLGDGIARGFVERLKIQTTGLGQQVSRLSGGNQQKVVVAKNLAIRPRVLLLDDPTVGIDVRSKADILDEVRELAAGGNAILVVSSELAELSALCDRVMILADGRLTGWLDRARGDDMSEEAITSAIQTAA